MGIEGNKSYDPNPVVGRSGQTILWVNGDTISHTVTSNSHENGLSKYSGMLFDSTARLSGHFYSKVFDLPGTYLYSCFYHPSMMEKSKWNLSDSPDLYFEQRTLHLFFLQNNARPYIL
ncbi:hypothetical protein BH23THE1_BH23THE1_14890 [soil metagenome]